MVIFRSETIIWWCARKQHNCRIFSCNLISSCQGHAEPKISLARGTPISTSTTTRFLQKRSALIWFSCSTLSLFPFLYFLFFFFFVTSSRLRTPLKVGYTPLKKVRRESRQKKKKKLVQELGACRCRIFSPASQYPARKWGGFGLHGESQKDSARAKPAHINGRLPAKGVHHV